MPQTTVTVVLGTSISTKKCVCTVQTVAASIYDNNSPED